MSEPASISTGIAARYASAVFDLASGDKALDGLEKDVDSLDAALASSADLRELISSPQYSRAEQASAVAAIADKMSLSVTTANLLGLLVEKRRLFVLPQLLAVLKGMLADARGEVTAEVISARPLNKVQSEKLAKTLTTQVGKTVKLTTSVDESLIGGLIVKVGSKMIDTSISSKLGALQNTMKEVG